jgi:hypothetical protein
VSGKPNTEPIDIHLPDDLPPVVRRAARALLELVDALEAIELDDDEAAA